MRPPTRAKSVQTHSSAGRRRLMLFRCCITHRSCFPRRVKTQVLPIRLCPRATTSTRSPSRYMCREQRSCHESSQDAQIPFNTACFNTLSNLQTLPNLIQKGKISSVNHIKAPLPPTLGGFPGLASIRYYLKCTVKRREFYKENPRVVSLLAAVSIC